MAMHVGGIGGIDIGGIASAVRAYNMAPKPDSAAGALRAHGINDTVSFSGALNGVTSTSVGSDIAGSALTEAMRMHREQNQIFKAFAAMKSDDISTLIAAPAGGMQNNANSAVNAFSKTRKSLDYYESVLQNISIGKGNINDLLVTYPQVKKQLSEMTTIARELVKNWNKVVEISF